jgi:hypothetical protein
MHEPPCPSLPPPVCKPTRGDLSRKVQPVPTDAVFCNQLQLQQRDPSGAEHKLWPALACPALPWMPALVVCPALTGCLRAACPACLWPARPPPARPPPARPVYLCNPASPPRPLRSARPTPCSVASGQSLGLGLLSDDDLTLLVCRWQRLICCRRCCRQSAGRVQNSVTERGAIAGVWEGRLLRRCLLLPTTAVAAGRCWFWCCCAAAGPRCCLCRWRWPAGCRAALYKAWLGFWGAAGLPEWAAGWPRGLVAFTRD